MDAAASLSEREVNGESHGTAPALREASVVEVGTAQEPSNSSSVPSSHRDGATGGNNGATGHRNDQSDTPITSNCTEEVLPSINQQETRRIINMEAASTSLSRVTQSQQSEAAQDLLFSMGYGQDSLLSSLNFVG